MSGGGSKPGERRGGRSKGTPNKATAAREAEVRNSGLTPLDFMLSRMRRHAEVIDAEEAKPPVPHDRLRQRDAEDKLMPLTDVEREMYRDTSVIAESDVTAREFAKDAAPYVHPKLAQVQFRGDKEHPLHVEGRLRIEFVKAVDGRPAEE